MSENDSGVSTSTAGQTQAGQTQAGQTQRAVGTDIPAGKGIVSTGDKPSVQTQDSSNDAGNDAHQLDGDKIYRKGRGEGIEKAQKDAAKRLGIDTTQENWQEVYTAELDSIAKRKDEERDIQIRLQERDQELAKLREDKKRLDAIVEAKAKQTLEALPEHLQELVVDTCGDNPEAQMDFMTKPSFQKMVDQAIAGKPTGNSQGTVSNAGQANTEAEIASRMKELESKYRSDPRLIGEYQQLLRSYPMIADKLSRGLV